ncbi:hypothetical protein C7212DRAFT_335492 [Tuber magnatum]|uniref:Uncharacterized protein n=1 Tax=Tuber magnatum TaxID=42249 RepID=A0A317SHF1_9PEZI|nr:hypothetical protein C7212DRAFT_335492 [Tuber magnatum]
MSESMEPHMYQNLLAQTADLVKTLTEFANIFCKIHDHKMARMVDNPDRKSPGYGMIISCGEADVAWKAEIMRNGDMESITRYRKLYHSVEPESEETRIQLIPLRTWEGLQCHHILKLHRSGQLKKDWWNYPIVINEKESDNNDDSSTKNNLEDKISPIEAGDRGPESSKPVDHTCSDGKNTILEASDCYKDTKGTEDKSELHMSGKKENKDDSNNGSKDGNLEDSKKDERNSSNGSQENGQDEKDFRYTNTNIIMSKI